MFGDNLREYNTYSIPWSWTTTTGGTLACHWCGVSLDRAARVTYLNGNLPVCDLCLTKKKKEA